MARSDSELIDALQERIHRLETLRHTAPDILQRVERLEGIDERLERVEVLLDGHDLAIMESNAFIAVAEARRTTAELQSMRMFGRVESHWIARWRVLRNRLYWQMVRADKGDHEPINAVLRSQLRGVDPLPWPSRRQIIKKLLGQ